MMCECDCQKRGQKEEKSARCSDNGDFECGICNCNDDRFGRTCECGKDFSSGSVDTTDESACKRDNTSAVCSGRGQCVCGMCDCSSSKPSQGNYQGTYCECDDFSCDLRDGKMCSGNGQCTCGGICKCYVGFSGKACECAENERNCLNPETKKVCSGRGKCKCGECSCDTNEKELLGRYMGQYCELCPSCHSCALFKNCVECMSSKSEMSTQKECDSSCSFRDETVDEVKKIEPQPCKMTNEKDCKIEFVYGYNETTGEVYVQVQRKDCPADANVMAIVMGVVGGIVAIGICILLIWKMLMTIHDKREFAKFEESRKLAKWGPGENPLYAPATSHFENPTYKGD